MFLNNLLGFWVMFRIEILWK